MQTFPLLAIAICVLILAIAVGRASLRRVLHNQRRRHYQRHPLTLELRHLAPACRPNRHRS
ncbi:MAG: hypothetical protein KF890_09090 [Nitrospira sp.]|nr:hypothetical protein [Nitrospira sp.]